MKIRNGRWERKVLYSNHTPSVDPWGVWWCVSKPGLRMVLLEVCWGSYRSLLWAFGSQALACIATIVILEVWKGKEGRTHEPVFPNILLGSAMSKHQYFWHASRYSAKSAGSSSAHGLVTCIFERIRKAAGNRKEETSGQIEVFIPSSLARGLGILFISHHTATAIKFERRSSDRSFQKVFFSTALQNMRIGQLSFDDMP